MLCPICQTNCQKQIDDALVCTTCGAHQPILVYDDELYQSDLPMPNRSRRLYSASRSDRHTRRLKAFEAFCESIFVPPEVIRTGCQIMSDCMHLLGYKCSIKYNNIACLYFAYIKLRVPRTPTEIASRTGVPIIKVRRSIKNWDYDILTRRRLRASWH